MRTWIVLLLIATNVPARADDLDEDVRDDDVAGGDDDADRSAGESRYPLELVIDAPGGPSRRVPAIAEVLEAAYAAAGLDRDPTGSWRRRARAAGLIPWLTARVGWDANWREHEPGEVGRSRDFEVRATWRLDRLLFDGRELQMSTIDTARRRERRRVASHAIRAYFAWRRVFALAAREPHRYALAVQAAEAELDALTDGWFSERTNSAR